MNRPRWHDVVLIAAIVGLVVLGVWALWEPQVKAALGHPADDPAKAAPVAPTPISGQT